MEPLPNELVDCVIGNLYSDIPSLLSCALAGRAWVRSSQRGIFRDIVFSLPSRVLAAPMDAYLNTARKLVASFDSRPSLALYVRYLELKNFFNQQGTVDELQVATANVIQQLSSLKHLKFREIHWGFLLPILRAALAELFRTSSLTEVTFLGLFGTSSAEVISLLNQMPRQLKALHLLSIYLDDLDEGTEHTGLPLKSIQLEKLTLSDCPANSFMDWFRKDTCPFEIRNLQSLHMSEYGGCVIDRHLHYVGRSLRELALDISSAYSDCLICMPNLRILHLRGIKLTSSSSPVPMICTILEPLFNPNNGNKSTLQCLKIDLLINHISQLVTHLDQWAEIDELLNRPEHSVLERVDVNLLSRTRSDLSGAGNLLGGKPRILEASGKLHIYIYHRV